MSTGMREKQQTLSLPFTRGSGPKNVRLHHGDNFVDSCKMGIFTKLVSPGTALQICIIIIFGWKEIHMKYSGVVTKKKRRFCKTFISLISMKPKATAYIYKGRFE